MDTENGTLDMENQLKERFLDLPQPLRKAIVSADIEKGLQTLSESHKLHLDQWQKLENEVMLAMLGFQPVEKLEENIKNEVGVSAETAEALASDIAEKIFLPIREELERELGPQEETPSGETADAVREVPLNTAPRAVSGEHSAAQNVLAVLPATQPPPPKTERAARAPISESYSSQTPSHERKAIEGDPYREAVG